MHAIDPLSRVEALGDVKPIHPLPGGLFTATMAADYFEVDRETIKQAIRRRRDKLTEDGLRSLNGTEFRDLWREVAASMGENLANSLSTTGKLLVLNQRCMLRLACTLKTSPVARGVATAIGQLADGHDSLAQEYDTIRVIQAAIHPIEGITQYRVPPYFVDLFVPSLRLAIECDEYGHFGGGYNSERERRRQEFIEESVGCRFLRYNPNEPAFNLGVVINAILGRHGAAKILAA